MKYATVEYLTKNYKGTFRTLTSKEYSKAVNDLNKPETSKTDWYEPYAYRDETKDIISVWDGMGGCSNALFTHYEFAKKVQFSTPYQYKDQVEVTVDGDKYGILIFDHEQNVWVLWPSTIDDGVSYSDDLAETQEIITEEIQG